MWWYDDESHLISLRGHDVKVKPPAQHLGEVSVTLYVWKQFIKHKVLWKYFVRFKHKTGKLKLHIQNQKKETLKYSFIDRGIVLEMWYICILPGHQLPWWLVSLVMAPSASVSSSKISSVEQRPQFSDSNPLVLCFSVDLVTLRKKFSLKCTVSNYK